MNNAEVLEVANDAIVVLLKIGLPILLVALIVGLSISLVQALTQIQEMTLSFVPKIIVIFVSLMMFLPFMLTTLSTFTETLMARIATGG